MKRALLVMKATERATFSERAATLGIGATLAGPTGAALWGALASEGRYARFEARAFDVFHSGQVRFSDAYPIVASGAVAWPTPAILVKHKDQAAVAKGKLQAQAVWVGRAAFRADNGQRQSARLDARFMTLDLDCPVLAESARLRTATEAGRAKPGALFGMQHIAPSEGLRYAALIESDLDDLWDDVLEPFQTGSTLRIGRARHTNAGGWYQCALTRGFSDAFFPADEPRTDASVIRIWALSDLAFELSDGEPPPSTWFGLPDGWRLLREESTIAYRRWAPWNAYLHARDTERMTIAAGSVLTYVRGEAAALDVAKLRSSVGDWKAQGLGRVCFSPAVLSAGRIHARKAAAIAPALNIQEPRPKGAAATPPTPLADWATRAAELADTTARDRFATRICERYDRVLSALRRTGARGPSASQWRAVAIAGLTSPDLTRLRESLFASATPICGKPNQDTRAKDWLASARVDGSVTTPREWLEATLKDVPPMPVAHLRWALDRLAKHAGRAHRAGEQNADD